MTVCPSARRKDRLLFQEGAEDQGHAVVDRVMRCNPTHLHLVKLIASQLVGGKKCFAFVPAGIS